MGDFDLPQSEDCLSLTIFAPEGAGPWPVILWLHGGAYLSGAGSLPWYDAGALARSGAVVVGVNYRLGPLGMLHVPGVARGDMLLQDIEAALDLGAVEYRRLRRQSGLHYADGPVGRGACDHVSVVSWLGRVPPRGVAESAAGLGAPCPRSEATERGRQFVAELGADPRAGASAAHAGGTGANAAGHGPVRGNPGAVPAEGGRGEHRGGIHRADRAGGGWGRDRADHRHDDGTR